MTPNPNPNAATEALIAIKEAAMSARLHDLRQAVFDLADTALLHTPPAPFDPDGLTGCADDQGLFAQPDVDEPQARDKGERQALCDLMALNAKVLLREISGYEYEPQALAILARLATASADYALGVEAAAKVCDERAAGRMRMYEDNQAGINAFKAVEAEECAAAIRALAKGGGA